MTEAQALASVLVGNVVNGTYYQSGTSQEVIDVLERLRARGCTVRVFYGDTKTGSAWPDENDVVGHIGRSMGPRKIPLLVPSFAHGGGGLLDDCIVGILNGDGGRSWSYKHPTFSTGRWHVDTHGVVFHDGKVHAKGFKSVASAMRYAAFMRGDRMAK